MLPFFVKFWKWKYFFWYPRPSRSGIHWPINFYKKNYVSVYKKVPSLYMDIHPGDSWPPVLWELYTIIVFQLCPIFLYFCFASLVKHKTNFVGMYVYNYFSMDMRFQQQLQMINKWYAYTLMPAVSIKLKINCKVFWL